MSGTNGLAVTLLEMMIKAGLSEESIQKLCSSPHDHIEHIDYENVSLPVFSD